MLIPISRLLTLQDRLAFHCIRVFLTVHSTSGELQRRDGHMPMSSTSEEPNEVPRLKSSFTCLSEINSKDACYSACSTNNGQATMT